MIDVLRQPTLRSAWGSSTTISVPNTRSPIGLELRLLAVDMAGRVDRDELTPDEESLLLEAVDDAVAAALPRIERLLDAELTPRVESLPLHARLRLASARRRRDLGQE